MATLKDTVVHNRLGVMEDIVLGDYQYNVVTDSGSSNGGLTFGDINYATTVQGDSLALVSNSDMTTSCVNYTVQTSGYQHYYAGTAMEITSGTTTNISSGGNMTISSSGTLTESGTSVTVNSTSGAVNITSNTTMGLTSGGNMTISSSGTLTESGTSVTVNSTSGATTIDANTYVSIAAPLVVSSYSYGTSEPSGSGTTGQLYFRIVTTT